MDNTETINILSLCTGYGGLELGLSKALEGVFRIVAVEIEAYALANLAAKAQEGKLAIEAMWPDLKTFPAERFRGCFDFVIAGYPCQGESIAGKQLGEKDPRWLWSHIRRIIEAVDPIWFFGENVENHINLGYPTVYASLRDMGYKVEAGLFTAAEVGAPHKRQRLFILAHSNEQRLEGQERGKSQGIRGRYKRCGQLADGLETITEERLEQGGITGTRGEVENAKRLGRRGRSHGEPAGQGRALQIKRHSQLADTAALGIQGPEPERTAQTRRQADEQGCFTRWPSRPGQPQYEWEEPRVVGDTKRIENINKRRGRIRTREKANEERQTDKYKPDRPSTKGQAQSRLGRTVDGSSCRVDRLRLLGNGVVLQQVEKAFRILMKLFEQPSPTTK